MPSRPVGFSEALRRGFGLAWSAPGVVGLGLLAEIGTDLLSLGAGLSIIGWIAGALGRTLGHDPTIAVFDPEAAGQTFLASLLQDGALLPLTGAALVAALLSLSLRLVWFAAGARVFAVRLGGGEAPRAMAATSHLHRAVPVAALFVPIYLALALYTMTVVGSGTLAFVRALQTRSGGFTGALSLALALALMAFLRFAFDALLQLALIRSVSGDVGAVEAVASAARVFASRAATILGLRFLFDFLGMFAAAISGSGGAVLLGSGAAAVALLIYARALSGLAGSVAFSLLKTAELGAFAALDAGDRGVLPEPVAPPPPPPPPAPARPLETVPVVTAEPVLETVLAPTKPEGS